MKARQKVIICRVFQKSIYFSARKFGFGRGGGILVRDEELFHEMEDYITMFEGFLTYGGMSVKEMEALIIGFEETLDLDIISQGPQFIAHCVKELDALGVPVRCYIPETLGGRNAGLTACLGLFYAYQDKLPITGQSDDSLDMDAFIKAVSYRDKKSDGSREDTLTNKLKSLFSEGKKN